MEPVVADEVPPADEAMVAEPEQEAPAADVEPPSPPSKPSRPSRSPLPRSSPRPSLSPSEPDVADEPVAEASLSPTSPLPPSRPLRPLRPSSPAPSRSGSACRARCARSARARKRDKPAERKPIVRLPKPEQELGRRQERQGTVVSDAMDKTIVVKVDTIGMHRRYKKVIRQSKKFHAHDETNQAKLGDVVRIVETRPLSKSKNWRLAEILEVAK